MSFLQTRKIVVWGNGNKLRCFLLESKQKRTKKTEKLVRQIKKYRIKHRRWVGGIGRSFKGDQMNTTYRETEAGVTLTTGSFWQCWHCLLICFVVVKARGSTL